MNKPLAWSHTALTQFVNCPKQYQEVKVLKHYPFKETPETKWGNEVHKALERRLIRKEALPGNMIQYEPLMQRLDRIPGTVYGEQQFAVARANYAPTTWFAKDAWCRAIVDAMWIDGKTCLVVDYKTGKYKPDNDQLKLFAAVVFQHFPEVQNVHTKFLWLQNVGAANEASSEVYNVNEKYALWDHFAPTINRLEQSMESDTWPMRQSGLCSWCPVTTCENWRVRRV